MKFLWRTLALIELVLLIGVTWFSNPAPSAHEAALFAADPVFMATVTFGAELLGGRQAEHHSYLFFSTTSLGDERLSVGALGHVWVVGEALQGER